uniref:BLTX297 n=1 Tax=Nephila pilipes TaxID=299642 RepID=A0A076KUR2_NEPPI|nr:BLTX297 [Nephila pilipes]AII97735.1 BLTX350 [Nephila pilipes]
MLRKQCFLRNFPLLVLCYPLGFAEI